jgi:DNA repair protein RecO (recombination protein O)
MNKIKVKGIIISETNYSESSKILNVLTGEYGLIGVISKGCRNYKSKLRSVSMKLTYGYFYINYKEEGLSTLTEVDLIDDLRDIKTDLTKIGYSSYLINLANQVIKQNDGTEIFDILESALLKINNNFDPAIITNIVELKYLSYLGVSPILDRCSLCGNTKDIITINSDSGGYLCSNCYTNEYITDEKTVKLLRMFEFVDINKIKEFNIQEQNKKEINKFLEDYYTKYTGLYLKSKSFLEQINQNY